MGSEVHIAELMNKIDLALEEASVLEEVLDSYDELLLVLVKIVFLIRFEHFQTFFLE